MRSLSISTESKIVLLVLDGLGGLSMGNTAPPWKLSGPLILTLWPRKEPWG